MTQQRFYPYTPSFGQPLICEHPECSYIAVWWDANYDAIWCDVHAVVDAEPPVRVQCEVCLQSYPASWVIYGVCADCRSVMPLLWLPDEKSR